MLRLTGCLGFGILCLAALTSGSGRAQTLSGRHYEVGVIRKSDRSAFKAQNLLFVGDSLKFVDRRTQRPGTLALSQVQQVWVEGGHPVVASAALLGGAMFVGALLGVKQAENDLNSKTSSSSRGRSSGA